MAATLASTWADAAATCAGLLFLLAAAGKLRHRALLPAVIANYRILPRRLARPFATTLPWVEAAIGLALILDGPWARGAAGVGTALLLAFAGAIELNIRRGRRHIDCGCGLGTLRQPLRRALVARNLGLAAALLPRIILPGVPPVADRAVGAAAGLSALLLLLLLDTLLALPDARTFPA